MLHIPFAAIKGFFDPSVQFGLQFDPATAADDRDAEEAEADVETEEAAGETPAPEGSGEKVVSLDAFRKKP
ncbi:Stringent starvation protein B [compost metagenome]